MSFEGKTLGQGLVPEGGNRVALRKRLALGLGQQGRAFQSKDVWDKRDGARSWGWINGINIKDSSISNIIWRQWSGDDIGKRNCRKAVEEKVGSECELRWQWWQINGKWQQLMTYGFGPKSNKQMGSMAGKGGSGTLARGRLTRQRDLN